jgi:hypothetical protein
LLNSRAFFAPITGRRAVNDQTPRVFESFTLD